LSPPSFPYTQVQALNAAWLTQVLAPLTGGAAVTNVETVEIIRTVATKIRFTAAFDGAPGGKVALCLKGLLDVDEQTARGGGVTLLEADFYDKLAPQLPVRRPDCVATPADPEGKFAIVIMRDVISQGGQFCSALEPFSPDQAAASLEQLALLHSGSALLEKAPWVKPRLSDFVQNAYVPETLLQEMLNGPRGEGLPDRTRNAGLLLQALAALAAHDADSRQYLIHGDCHAGNIYRTAEGAGLIDWQIVQRGGWALDIAYHIAAVLPVEIAEKEERALLGHYLTVMRKLGNEMPAPDEAWQAYRKALVYGYYLWAITRRVDPPIINLFNNRLGAAITRHESYSLLGV
jgi:Phosphotransferase enzyme family